MPALPGEYSMFDTSYCKSKQNQVEPQWKLLSVSREQLLDWRPDVIALQCSSSLCACI